MKNKKIIPFVLALFVTGLFIAGCAGQEKTAAVEQKAAKPQEIHIAYQNSSITILLAKAKGFYEDEFAKDGVQVKYDLYLAGPPMMEAFAGGRADFAHTGDMPPVSARASGVDLKIIARAGYTPAGNALLIRPDSPFQSVSELKGKKIAVPIGSSAHHYLILLLKQNGLTANDVNIVNMQASDHQAALETSNVDAVATWEPWVSVLNNAHAGKVLADSSSGVKRYVGVLLVRNDFAKPNHHSTARMLPAPASHPQFL